MKMSAEEEVLRNSALIKGEPAFGKEARRVSPPRPLMSLPPIATMPKPCCEERGRPSLLASSRRWRAAETESSIIARTVRGSEWSANRYKSGKLAELSEREEHKLKREWQSKQTVRERSTKRYEIGKLAESSYESIS